MAFARRDYFYPNAVEQKYQNLSQLHFRSFIVWLVTLLNLQANFETAAFRKLLVSHQTIAPVCEYFKCCDCSIADDRQLGDRDKEMAAVRSVYL